MITVVSHIVVDTKLAQHDILDRWNRYKTQDNFMQYLKM